MQDTRYVVIKDSVVYKRREGALDIPATFLKKCSDLVVDGYVPAGGLSMHQVVHIDDTVIFLTQVMYRPDATTEASSPQKLVQSSVAATDDHTTSVELTHTGIKKMYVLRAIREATDLGMNEANELVENTPKVIPCKLTKAKAEELLAALRAAGALARIV
jgi:ribosomal protein L7/L12